MTRTRHPALRGAADTRPEIQHRAALGVFGFVVAAVVSMVIHLFGPLAHADVHSEFAGLASGIPHEVAATAAGPAAEHHASGAAAVAPHQAGHIGAAAVNAGDASHDDDGCTSVIRPSGSSLNHPMMGCVEVAWQPRVDNRSALTPARSSMSDGSAAEVRNPGIQRI